MQKIKLTDRLSAAYDVEVASFSALGRYVKQLAEVCFGDLDFSELGGRTLADPAVRSLTGGAVLSEPVEVGDGRTMALGLAGRAFCKTAAPLPLDGDEDRTGALFVCFGLDLTASAAAPASLAGLAFGVTPSAKVELASYTRFPSDSNVTMLTALRQAVAGFVIPASSADLAQLAPGQVVSVAASGKIVFSSEAQLLACPSLAAQAPLPDALPKLAFGAGGSIAADFACTLEADYRLVARRLDDDRVRLGWYHGESREFDVSVTVKSGVSATFGATDLFAKVLSAISADARADLAELTQAGVPADQAAAIQGAVRAAVARKIELCITGSLGSSRGTGATFLYDIEPGALNSASRAALDRALHGDLSALDAGGLAGVTCLRSIASRTRARHIELEINLFGILNHRSLAELALTGSVLHEPATGALILTDTATAQRISTTAVNWGADSEKLRQVLASSFFLSAAYHAAGQLDAPATLRCRHAFFEMHSTTTPKQVQQLLAAAVGLGLIHTGEAELPTGVKDFGRTLLSLTVEYPPGATTRMFLDDSGRALPLEAYETAGRMALQSIVIGTSEEDAARLRPAIEDALWAAMRKAGQTGFSDLLAGVSKPTLAAITADYSNIVWWADAMRGTALVLAQIHAWQTAHPAASPSAPAFQTLRRQLAAHLERVAATTREDFGRPWGLLAMSQLSSAGVGASAQISSPCYMWTKRREPALAAG